MGQGSRRDKPGRVNIRGDFGNDERTPWVWGVASAVFTPGRPARDLLLGHPRKSEENQTVTS